LLSVTVNGADASTVDTAVIGLQRERERGVGGASGLIIEWALLIVRILLERQLLSAARAS
jgi:hypothetical protein